MSICVRSVCEGVCKQLCLRNPTKIFLKNFFWIASQIYKSFLCRAMLIFFIFLILDMSCSEALKYNLMLRNRFACYFKRKELRFERYHNN